MANNFKISNTSANAAANAVAALCNSGKLRVYSGTQPADANTALSGNTLLAELAFGSTAFGSASAGVATANAITSATAGNTGTATFFRVVESDGSTVVFDGSAGTASADLVLGTTSIVSGATVSVSSLTYTQPES
jgi:hypothetical protein